MPRSTLLRDQGQLFVGSSPTHTTMYEYNLDIHTIMRIAISNGAGARYWRMRLYKLDKNTYPRLRIVHTVGKKKKETVTYASFLYANDKKITVRSSKGLKDIQRHSIKSIRIGDAKANSNVVSITPDISGSS